MEPPFLLKIRFIFTLDGAKSNFRWLLRHIFSSKYLRNHARRGKTEIPHIIWPQNQGHFHGRRGKFKILNIRSVRFHTFLPQNPTLPRQAWFSGPKSPPCSDFYGVTPQNYEHAYHFKILAQIKLRFTKFITFLGPKFLNFRNYKNLQVGIWGRHFWPSLLWKFPFKNATFSKYQNFAQNFEELKFPFVSV